MQTSPRNISFGWSLETIPATWQNLGFLFPWFCLVGVFLSCSREELISELETQRKVEVRTETVKMEVRSRKFPQVRHLTSHKKQLLVFLTSRKNQPRPTQQKPLISLHREIWAKRTRSFSRRSAMEHDNSCRPENHFSNCQLRVQNRSTYSSVS